MSRTYLLKGVENVSATSGFALVRCPLTTLADSRAGGAVHLRRKQGNFMVESNDVKRVFRFERLKPEVQRLQRVIHRLTVHATTPVQQEHHSPLKHLQTHPSLRTQLTKITTTMKKSVLKFKLYRDLVWIWWGDGEAKRPSSVGFFRLWILENQVWEYAI
jgi:hypothetical protein